MNLFQAHFLDRFSPELLFGLTLLLMLVFIELGYRIGRRPQANTAKAQHSQVRAVMGAALGLTAFMLAFTFATAQSHYETRIQAMLEETRLANNAFLQAEFMPDALRSEARSLLREYLGGRLAIGELAREGRIEEITPLVSRAEGLQEAMWELSVALAERDAELGVVRSFRDPFTQSVIGLMDLHTARLEATMHNRIPYVIWLTLYLTGALSMLIMGYQAGLVGKRSPVATFTLAAAFSVVMMLITDLDRPVMSLFEIDDQIVEDTVERMDALMADAGER